MQGQKGSVLLATLVIISALALVTIGYFFGMSSTNISNLNFESSSPTPTPSTVDETAGWKTYTNTNVGFSVQIPPEEVVMESIPSNDWVFAHFISSELTIAKFPPQVGDATNKKLVKSTSLTLPNGENITLVLLERTPPNVPMDGYVGMDEVSVEKSPGFTDKVYIDAKIPRSESGAKFELITKILSTFRFLEPQITPTPTDIDVSGLENYDKVVTGDYSFYAPEGCISSPREIVNDLGLTQYVPNEMGQSWIRVSKIENYNQKTGKPYASIDEYVGLSYKTKVYFVDGVEGRQPLPRAGSENTWMAVFFSRDLKFIYSFKMEPGDQKPFDEILGTFRFL